MPQNFLFLRILDREINTLLQEVIRIVSGIGTTQAIHITIRGPYKKAIPESIIQKCKTKMQYDILNISNVDRFSNQDEEIIYLKVDSSNLKKICWKRDFPIYKYSFNPHISLYRGNDTNWADRIEEFLGNEKIQLSCTKYEFVPYLTKQASLLPDIVPTSSYLSPVHKKCLLRLEQLSKDYRSDNKHATREQQTLLL